MDILQRSITDLKGVGAQVAARLAKLQIKTIQDVLFHLPSKYVDRTRIYPIASLRMDDTVVIEGVVQKTSVIPKPKRSLMVNLTDASGHIVLRFFHFNAQQQAQFQPGVKVRCVGTVRAYKSGKQIIHPEYRVLQPDAVVPVEEYLTAVYPTCEGVSQRLLRALVQQALQLLAPIKNSLDILPAVIREELQYLPWFISLEYLHKPTPDLDIVKLQKRMAFEELLAQHLLLRQKRQQLAQEHAYPIAINTQYWSALLNSLPFDLTDAQKKVIAVIEQDLTKSQPMRRLVQGDVGSGKTLVGVAAALQVIAAKMQVAFMVPTEILAEQHWHNLCKWCEPLGLRVALLTASLSAKERAGLLEQIIAGEIDLVIGTHALLQDDVNFKQLALVIIDEQHRFGVEQRLALRNKGTQPHQLILTATPIPRTLAMTFHADMDYAVVDELPPDRKPITTILVSSDRRAEILQRINSICAAGQQVYWVCTLIEESEVLDCTPAEQAWQDLVQALPALQIGLIHGRMKAADKERIMRDFVDGKINLLVATTVIEVGVDVPNASLMIIENPERLGLAQLHQLRGRVGRGNAQSYCVLLYKKPMYGRVAQRLQFLRDSQDGFAIAEFDLQLRGPGEVFGTRQSGIAQLRIADLVRDKDLLPKVIAAADIILREHPAVVPKLVQRWIRDQVQYAVV